MALSDLRFDPGLAFESCICKQCELPINHSEDSPRENYFWYLSFLDPSCALVKIQLALFSGHALGEMLHVSRYLFFKIGPSNSLSHPKRLALKSFVGEIFCLVKISCFKVPEIQS